MAPADVGPTLLFIDAPAAAGMPAGMNYIPGYTLPPILPVTKKDKELFSTSVLRTGQAKAQFTSRAAQRMENSPGSCDSEADSVRAYRPGEILMSTAKLSSKGIKDRTSSGSSGGSGSGSESEGMNTDAASRVYEGVAPAVGSPGMPTLGSVGHWFGNCKPCAFAFKGCQNGVACQFCHLCLPGEKQRRRKLSKLANKCMLGMQQ